MTRLCRFKPYKLKKIKQRWRGSCKRRKHPLLHKRGKRDMSFDIANPADLLALKTEVADDPLGLGYAATGGSTADLLALLNDPANNTGGETGPDFLTTRNFLSIIFAENISAGDQFRVSLLYANNEGGDINIDKHRGDVALLNDTGLDSRIAALVRSLSRAEVLFSDIVDGAQESVVITRTQWITARDS